jgi:hypothetical protein
VEDVKVLVQLSHWRLGPTAEVFGSVASGPHSGGLGVELKPMGSEGVHGLQAKGRGILWPLRVVPTAGS